jgi:cobalt/nickel transport system permease protein
MHIPTSMMDGAVCPVTAAVSVCGLALAAGMACKAKEKPASARFAAVSALIFAGQMVNFPVLSGTSGHLLGGVLAAALLGVPFGVLATALVVTLQCLVFADGGLAVLGANLLNMAILGAGVGGWIWQRLAARLPERKSLTLGLAAWLSVLLAALGCSLELAAAGTIPLSRVIPAMLSVHALIGIGEAVVTVAVVALFSRAAAPQASERRPVFILGIAAFIIALVGAPFACGWPDGLESVAETLGFLHASAPSFVAPLSGYTFPAISNEMLSVSLAAQIGVVVTFLAAWFIAKTWQRCPAAK